MKINKATKYILIFFTVWMSIHILIMLVVGLSRTTHSADSILIFGNKVESNGDVSKRLQSRLDEGIRLFEDEKAQLIVVSGGFGKDGFDEAKVMANYLIENGIPIEAIIEDPNGINTYETAKNLREIAKDKNIKSVIIVTQYYHILRAELALKKFGFDSVSSSYAKMAPELRDLYSIPREVIGFYFYIYF